MMSGLSKLVIAASVMLIVGVIGAGSTDAQVTLDGSANRNFTGPAPFADGNYDLRAELGRQAGRNLFHSFGKFSLRTGESATFSAPDEAGVQRVISRVTGGERSDIDGTIKSTIAGADFYFINPAGVLFGPNASLDVQGSFHVSTADEVRFADGKTFSASNLASSFTVAAPEAFGFLGGHDPAPILVDQSALGVPPGKSLSLVGGDIDITGGTTGILAAEAGRISLAAIGGRGEARIRSGETSAPRHADISLTDQALVSTSGDGGGTVRIEGGRIVIDDSFVFADNNQNTGASGGIEIDADRVATLRNGSIVTADAVGEGSGGNVVVRAGTLAVSDGSLLAADTSATGNAGNVEIDAGQLRLSSGGQIRSQTSAQGNAGRVAIDAEGILIRGNDEGVTGILSDAEPGSSGSAGTVTVSSAGEVKILEGGEIRSETFAAGNAGAVTLTADRLLIQRGDADDVTGLLSSAEPGSSGSAGTVTVAAGEIKILEGGEIRSSTFGEGNAGAVNVDAARLLVVRGTDSSISSNASTGVGAEPSSGNAGTVTVAAGEVQILQGGVISSNTSAAGNAGAVTVTADRLLLIERGDTEADTGILSDAKQGSSGSAGTVTVAAGEAKILQGGVISSNTFAVGNAGVVTVTADGVLIQRRDTEAVTGILSDAEPGSSGSAGRVTVTAVGLRVLDGGQISSETFAVGGAGAVTVTADQLLIRPGDTGAVTGIFSDSGITGDGQRARGNAGTIRVTAGELRVLDGGEIRSDTFAEGNAGAVNVAAARLLVVQGPRSRISSRAITADGADPSTGNAGRVFILAHAGEVQLLGGGAISSDTFARGNAGSVDVDAKRLVMRGPSEVSSDSKKGSQGNAGNVTVDAGTLIMRDTSAIHSNTFGPGNAGNVRVTAGRLLMDETGEIASDVGPGATGNGGTVTIVPAQMTMGGGSAVSSNTFGSGNAGNVTVNAGGRLDILDDSKIASETTGRGDAGQIVVSADHLVLDGRSVDTVPLISSASTIEGEARAQGNAGDVIIRANTIEVLRGGRISATTFADGRGGDVVLETGLLAISAEGSLRPTGVFSGSEGGPEADGGMVRVQADTLFVGDGGVIRGSTFGPGDAGSVEVVATDIVVAGGAAITSEAFKGSSGIAGDVTLRAGSILLTSGGTISSSSQGLDAAGTVTISADGSLTLSRGNITTASGSAGGGEIIIRVQDVFDAHDSRISATVAGGQDPTAGNILIDPKILVIDGSKINADANADEGFGGNVRIEADNILVPGGDFLALVERGDISASGGTPERAGIIAVNAPEVDMSGGLVVLEGALLDTAPLRARCGARRDVGASSFTGVGRGGLPPSPDGPLASRYFAADVAPAAAGSVLPATGSPSDLVPPCAPRS